MAKTVIELIEERKADNEIYVKNREEWIKTKKKECRAKIQIYEKNKNIAIAIIKDCEDSLKILKGEKKIIKRLRGNDVWD